MLNHNTKLRVGHVLKTIDETRDSDIQLTREVWLAECPQMSPQINDLCNAIKLGQLTFPDTLTRARRSLQERNSSLRGELWDMRHHKAEDIRQSYFSFFGEV